MLLGHVQHRSAIFGSVHPIGETTWNNLILENYMTNTRLLSRT